MKGSIAGAQATAHSTAPLPSLFSVRPENSRGVTVFALPISLLQEIEQAAGKFQRLFGRASRP